MRIGGRWRALWHRAAVQPAARLAAVLRAVREVLGLVRPWQRVVVIGGLLVSSLLELFGLAMIVPLMASVASLGQGRLGLVAALRAAVEGLGLPFHPATFLVLIIAGLSSKAVVSIAVMRYVGRLVAKIDRRMRLEVIHGLLRAQWGFFAHQRLGRLGGAVGAEAAAAGECFLTLSTLLAAGLQTLLFLAVAAVISLELAAIGLGAVLLMLVAFGRLVRRGREADRVHRRRARGMGNRFIDAIAGIKPLRAMGRTDHFAALFAADARALADAERRGDLAAEHASELQEPIIGTAIALGFLYAATTTTLAGHELLIMGILIVRTVRSARPIQRGLQRFAQDHDRFSSLNRFLERVLAAAEPGRAGGAAPTLSRAVEVEGVVFAHAGRRVLDGLSLEIPAGRITTLTGPSGVGKSTLIDLVAGLHRPAAGRVLVDGRDLADLDLAAWRRMIGYVPQETLLLHTTIADNVTLGVTLGLAPDAAPGIDGAAAAAVRAALEAAGAWEFVAALDGGVRHVVGERGTRLSGGQRQRIAIARALYHRPRLLILDEATTGLDRASERRICGTIVRLVRDDGLTVLAISHQKAWRDVADHVWRIDDARTVRPVPAPGSAQDPAKGAALLPAAGG